MYPSTLRFVAVSAIATVLLLAGGCSPAKAPQILLQSLPLERPALELEWRDARRVPAGKGMLLALGAAPEGAVVRLGLLDDGANPVTATVSVDGEPVATFATSGAHTWHDERLNLTQSGSSCTVELSAESSFWVSHAEVFVPKPEAPAVLIFLIDALRQDHLGCYGYPLETSPNIDAFARDAVRLTGLTPSTSWTRASVASLFTSTYPSVHGAEDRPDVMRKGLPSLAAQFAQGGLETHCFMTNRNCIPVWGFGEDFHRFRDVDTKNWINCDDADVVDATIETIEDVAGRPWYAYVHTMGPHDPYNPPEPYDEQFEHALYAERDSDPAHQEALALYDGEIAYTDLQFGRIMSALKNLGLYDSALIVVMADHGEEFWDHGGTGHGRTLYEEQLRVPFIIKLPENACAGEIRDGLAEIVDVAPTLLDMFELEADPRFQGTSVFPLIRGEGPGKPMACASLALDNVLQRAAKSGKHKYIQDLAREQTLWFDLVADPAETSPLEEPPEEALPLSHYALAMDMRGASGLHMLVVNDAKTQHTVSGTIRTSSADSFELRYPAALHEANLDAGVFEFSIFMATQSPDAPLPPSWERIGKIDPMHNLRFLKEEALPDSAHLILRVSPEDVITLDIRADGQPAAPGIVRAGADARNLALDNQQLAVASLTADPWAFDPALLPREFGLYFWYVPPISTVEDQELSPELREALRDLGY